MSSTIPLAPSLATLVPTATATRIGHFIPTQPLSAEQVAISKAFYALLIVPGNVLIPILLVVAIYLRNAYSRSILFMNFWASWIGYCLGFLALFYTGDWDDVPDQPNFVLCEIQAIFVFITPVWTASTTVALIFQLWLSVVSLGRSTNVNAESGQTRFWNERTRTMALFWFPYIIFVIYAFGATMIAISRPELVGYDFLFCTVDFQPLRVAVSLYTAAVLLFGIGCQLDIGRRLYRERLAVKRVKVQGWPVISLFTRMMCFIVVSLSGVVASVLATRNNALKDERQIIQGVLPLVSFLIFGTNMGIYRRDRTSSGKSSISS